MTRPDIFHIEDDPDFAFIMEHAVVTLGSGLRINIVPDGKRALVLLQQFATANCVPRLILLDYNLPGISGVDVLIKIKGIKALADVPVIILSTSDNPRDAEITLRLGAEAFQTKPMGYQSLIGYLKTISATFFNDNSGS